MRIANILDAFLLAASALGDAVSGRKTFRERSHIFVNTLVMNIIAPPILHNTHKSGFLNTSNSGISIVDNGSFFVITTY